MHTHTHIHSISLRQSLVSHPSRHSIVHISSFLYAPVCIPLGRIDFCFKLFTAPSQCPLWLWVMVSCLIYLPWRDVYSFNQIKTRVKIALPSIGKSNWRLVMAITCEMRYHTCLNVSPLYLYQSHHDELDRHATTYNADGDTLPENEILESLQLVYRCFQLLHA